jgi:16S rRNA (adenine1518-N6/adenine1519-N6)-dimethyltransferase
VDLQVVSASLARASRERMKRFDIRPNRELGQNFLVDDNILGVIGSTASLRTTDTVLEIGGGLGILSEYLANRVQHLHVVETDRRLERVLEDALDDHPNTSLLIADVMDVDLRSLAPAPNKVVANLPYGVAVPAIIKTIDELGSVDLWCVMVQREIADRLTAKPGTKEYGAPSVTVQLGCEVSFVRSVSPHVFHPEPHVASALLVLHRAGDLPDPIVRKVVRAGFAHRRKSLARSLQLAFGRDDLRDPIREAVQDMDHPPDVRAERLSPKDFVLVSGKLSKWL